MSEELFYIQNKGFSGNCLIWWAVDGHGYTSNLDKAWKVSKEKAEEIRRNRPDQDMPRAVAMVDSLAVRHCSQQLDWEQFPRKR